MEEKKHLSEDKSGRPDGDKALWDLLGSARKVEAGPMFSRNVLREVRNIEDDAFSWQKLIQLCTRPALAVTAAAVLIVSGIFAIQNRELANVDNRDAETDVIEFIDPAEEFESIEMLGELMAVTDPGSLSDEALFNLLF